MSNRMNQLVMSDAYNAHNSGAYGAYNTNNNGTAAYKGSQMTAGLHGSHPQSLVNMHSWKSTRQTGSLSQISDRNAPVSRQSVVECCKAYHKSHDYFHLAHDHTYSHMTTPACTYL